MAITFTRASSAEELRQILVLQKQNRPSKLSEKEVQKEGFTTVGHSYEILKKMNDACPHIIIKDNNLVVGYALVMLPSFRDEIPDLGPMFEAADDFFPDVNYVAMGQICIAKSYRKQGLFKGMYHYYRQQLQNDYDCLLTEVAVTNQRSIQAHKAVGFVVLKTRIADGVYWEVMSWDWS